ncbi:MAG: carboxypeptidase-like regulatory domain-containing protein [Balneolaceae bacterium]
MNKKNGFMTLRKPLFGLFVFLLTLTTTVYANPADFSDVNITVSGTVTDESGVPVAGASVVVQGSVVGVATRQDGTFTLTYSGEPPITLVISMVGFQSREISIESNSVTGLVIELQEQVIMGSDVVVSASRYEESILRSPVSIEKMDLRTIRDTPAPGFYDAIADMPGVQFNTSGLTFKSVNTRAFSTIANTRFVQLIDGVDNAPPGLNFPAGNLVGVSELDVETVELVPGAASALYGPNAFNGILIVNGKSPFLHQGISVLARSGVTSQQGGLNPAGDNLFYEFALRYAQQLNDRFAFKVNASVMQGTEWNTSDYRDMDSHPLSAGLRGSRESNPSYDGLNIYGDEVATTLDFRSTPFGDFGRHQVSRTGYREVDLIDSNAESYKVDASLNYRVTEGIEAIYQYRLGAGTGVYQGFSRYSLNNIVLQYHKLELRGSDFFLRAYGSFEDAGDSYDSRFLAWNINREWKSDQDWFQEYGQTFVGARAGGMTESAAHDAARSAADDGRLIPGTTQFNTVRDEIRNLADLAEGSRFIDKSNFLHLEGNYDFRSMIDLVDVQVGGNVRRYELNSEGTLFNDLDGAVGILEWGAYTQLSRSLMDDRLRLTTSVRVDQNENFDPQISPRASAVFSLDGEGNHNIRASYQTGFRNPDTQSQYIALDLGPAFLMGGTVDNVTSMERETALNNGNVDVIAGIDAYENAYSAQAAQAAAEAGSTPEALSILIAGQAETDYVKPEQIQSVEVGYKGLIGRNLYMDAAVYHNWYSDFQIARNVVVIPEQYGDVSGGSGAAALLGGNYKVFQLYTNTGENVTSQGLTLNLNYALPGGYTVGGNYSWADFSLDTEGSDYEAGFNTPNHRFGLTFGNRSVIENLGFNLSYRWSDSYLWESTFGVGEVPAHNTLDLQFSWSLPAIGSTLKVGGSNILNRDYRTAFGGPGVGGQYYISLRYDAIFTR